MTRTRIASAAALLLLAGAALLGPAASAQTPSPSASGSPAASPSGSQPAASPSSTGARQGVALLVSAEPDTIDLGEETVLVAQVTNTGTGSEPAASLTVTLPSPLELVSAFPAPASSDGGTHTFDLGPLDPGESAVAQITATGTTVAEDAVVAATAAIGAATAGGSTNVSVTEGGDTGALNVSSHTSRVLSEVGSMVHYEVTVSNDGDEDLENVLVVDVAPAEVEVFSVDIVDEVEAVQIGEAGGRHDIVWNVGSLPAGTTVDLPWDGRAARAGDLRAVNSVRGLLGPTEATRSVSESFLAAEGARDLENPPFEPIRERVVTFVDPPPGDTAERAATQPGTVLPFTGADPARILRAGMLLFLGGLLLLGGARLAREPRKALAAAVLAGLLGVACVSGSGDDPQGAAPQASPRTFVTDDPLDDGDTKVKGERIVKGEEADETPAPEVTPAPSAPPAPARSAPPATGAPQTPPPSPTPPPAVAAPASPPPPTTAPVDTTPVRVVRVVTTELEDLPVEAQPSRAGDNSISFGWDDGITAASSGVRYVRGSSSELLTDLSSADGAISNRMTLRNTTKAVRLSVRGRLVHEVYEGSRLVARLRSDPIDVVLSPGGQVVARFSYLLPAGDYTVVAAFETSQ